MNWLRLAVSSSLLFASACALDHPSDGEQVVENDYLGTSTTVRQECMSSCYDSCFVEDDQDICRDRCIDQTEDDAAAFITCENRADNCEETSVCLERLGHTTHIRAECESLCIDLSDGEGPELNSTSQPICDNRCNERSAGFVENFVVCCQVDVPDGTNTYQGCFDQNLD